MVKISDVTLRGRHNLLNVMPAGGVARLLDITKEQINQALSTFIPVEHRLELVGRTENGVEFVNDSAGTTPESAIAALEAYQGQSVILIAGGSDKGAKFDQLAVKILDSRIKLLILFPTTGGLILAAVKKLAQTTNALVPSHVETESMKQAFVEVKKVVSAGDVVLLSPACASFSTFANYADRGKQFKQQAELFFHQGGGDNTSP